MTTKEIFKLEMYNFIIDILNEKYINYEEEDKECKNFTGRPPICLENKDYACYLYQNTNLAMPEIEKQTNMSYATVYRELKKRKIPLRQPKKEK